MVKNWVVKICQTVLYPLVYIPFRVLYKKNLTSSTNFEKDKKYIFVANHPSRIDPFLMFYLMPYKELKKILPIRFMTAEEYMRGNISSLILGLIGCYRIGPGVIGHSIDLLKNKNNLCIFIQGKIEQNANGHAKVGAVCIEQSVNDCYLVPVKIEYTSGKFRRNAKIKFKDFFRHKKFPKNLQPLANKLLKEIID